MQFDHSFTREGLDERLAVFLDLVGRQRWTKRTAQLHDDMHASPFREKIVFDYHWLEIALLRADILPAANEALEDQADVRTSAALHFAATVVEVHKRLDPSARRVLEGRLRDALNAENGFAPLYLEMDVARMIVASGGDINFPDADGSGAFDLLVNSEERPYEIECKSISVDAGRAIHRKAFYRFMEKLIPAIDHHWTSGRHDILALTLRARLPADSVVQQNICSIVEKTLRGQRVQLTGTDIVTVERHACSDIAEMHAFTGPSGDQLLRDRFGSNAHIAGGFTDAGGCIVVVRSEREDDTSLPILEAMRKGAKQLSTRRPSFIAVQFQDIEPADLLKVHLRRRMAILSYAVFGHYGAAYVNASYFCGYGASVVYGGTVGTPAFFVKNPKPTFLIDSRDATFLKHVPDAEFAELIGAPLPEANISKLSFDW